MPSLVGFPTRVKKEISSYNNVWVAGKVGLVSTIWGVGRSAVGGSAPLRPAGRHGEGQVPYPGWRMSLGSGFPAGRNTRVGWGLSWVPPGKVLLAGLHMGKD